MKIKSVSTAEFIRHFGRYHDEARREPLTLTKHGRPSVVVLSMEEFTRMAGREDPRRAYGFGETPAELADMLLDGLDRKIAEIEADQDG